MEVEVSIILPCYNIEKHLEKCINSIQKQTLQSFEAIFIDDGSLDNTVTKFREIRPDSRYKLYSKENEGSGIARNYGLNIANGKYIYFMDPDDTISPNLLEDNLKMMRKNNADLNVFGYQTIEYTTGHTTDVIPKIKKSLENREEIYEEIFIKPNNISVSTVWSKFYKHSFLTDNNLRFSNLRVGQDFEFNLQVFDYVERINVIPKKYYNYYRIRPGSVRTEYNPNQYESEKVILNTLINKAHKWGKILEFHELLNNYKIYVVFGEFLNLKKIENNNFDKLLNDSLYLEVKQLKYKEAKSKLSKIKLMFIKFPQLLIKLPIDSIPLLFH